MMHRLLTSAIRLAMLIFDQMLSYLYFSLFVFFIKSFQKLFKEKTKGLPTICISIVMLGFGQLTYSQCPTITAISTTAMDCADGTVDFLISPSIFPLNQGNYIYQWTGPNGYTFADSVAIIPNGTSLDNGTYTLVVSDGLCNSAPKTIVINIIDKPITPLIEKGDSLCVGEQLKLSVANSASYSGTTIEYQWTSPTGQIITASPELIINNTNATHSGKYKVLVVVDACVSDLSTEVDVLVSDFPTRPIAEIVPPVCEGDTIQLKTNEVPEANYQWIGPNGFMADINNPLINGVTPNHQGEYRVRIVLQQCASEYSLPVMVKVNSLPATPVAQNNGPVCIGNGNNSLELSVSDLSYVDGQSYTWIDSITGNIIAGPLTTQTVSIIDFSNYTDGDWNFQVIASANGCSSAKSAATTAHLNFIPTEQARAGTDKRVCSADTVRLLANEAITGIGTWENLTPLPANIENINSASTKVSNLKSDTIYQFEWSLANGVCGIYDRDTLQVFVNDENLMAVADSLLEFCDSNVVNLNAIAPVGNTLGFWTQDIQQAEKGIVITKPDSNNTTVTNLIPANEYTFFWTLSNEACGNYSTAVTTVIISDDDFQAIAGEDIEVCGQSVGTLRAQNESGTWTSLDMDANIQNP
ncbi:MAG TPA: hypothetical protein ENK52_01350, partial [Saprospiraceae bacterium]|nr:hypothetical protein [Saprospiraceae bacterium]